MIPKRLGYAVSLLVVIPMAMAAQLAREHDPVILKHWSAPLYWERTQPAVEEAAVATAAPAASLPPGVTALVFVGMAPCRIADTRAGQGFTGAFGPPSLAGGARRTFPVQSSNEC